MHQIGSRLCNLRETFIISLLPPKMWYYGVVVALQALKPECQSQNPSPNAYQLCDLGRAALVSSFGKMEIMKGSTFWSCCKLVHKKHLE